MFGIGSSEILIILLFVVVLLGPKKIPEVARMLGKLIGSAKKVSEDFKDEISKNMDTSEKTDLIDSIPASPSRKESENYRRTYEPTEPYTKDPYEDIDKDDQKK